jgi:hypothetical protein
MNALTEKVIEFWDNLKESFPEGIKLEAADQLAAHFMGESAEIEFGLGYDPDQDDIELDDFSNEINTNVEDFESSNEFEESDRNN